MRANVSARLVGAGSLKAVAVLVGGLSLSTVAHAAPLALAPLPGEALVQTVAGGCGPGWHPNPWGVCRPNFGPRPYWRRPVVYAPYGYYRPRPVYRPYGFYGPRPFY